MPEQKDRILKLKSPLGDKRCGIRELSGYERLNSLFSFDLTLFTDQDQERVKADELLGENVTITLIQADVERKVHGVVCEFDQVDPLGENLFEYRVSVVPRLWLLGLSSHNRIYENMNAVDIVKQVVQDGCQMSVETSNLKTYPTREICCQFGETDLAFVQRLLAEEGIAYYFKHGASDCKLVLCGGMNGFQTCSPASYPYNETNKASWLHQVSRFKQSGRLCTGKLVSTDYSEYAASSPLDVEATSRISPMRLRPGERALHGRHDFERIKGVRSLSLGDCTNQAKRWMAGVEAEGEEFTGESKAPSLIAGYKFDLQDAPIASGGEKQFLVTEIVHSATEGHDEDSFYSNSFRCVATSNAMAFTPPPPVERPRLWGPHTATVVDVLDPEMDFAHAEVQVMFPWDSEHNSCWARVGQLYAGREWGSYFVPDIGQEVLVEFINGDPDRPVVVGSVYNSENPIVPYKRLQSGIRTRTNNELRFDDNPGAEEVYLEASRDHNRLVLHDETGKIENDQSLEVVNNQDIKIGQERKIEVGGNQSTDVTENVRYKSGQSIEIEAGQRIEMKAGTEIKLIVGGSSLKIDHTGVTIEGTMVKVKGNAMTEVTGATTLVLKGGITTIN